MREAFATKPWLKYVLIAVIALGLVAAGIGVGRLTTPAPTPSAPTPAPTPTATPTGPNVPVYSTVMTEVAGAPGLWWGTATVTSGYTDTILGVPIGWKHTVDGAIGAAISTAASVSSLNNAKPDTAKQLDDRLLTANAQRNLRTTREQWDKTKAWFHLNDEGQPLDGSGDISTTRTLHWASYPRYAAYKVTELHSSGTDLDTVNVSAWMPLVYGVTQNENNLSPLQLEWVQLDLVMKWEDGDWRTDSFASVKTPQGSERRANLPWSTVASLLGPGWSIPADATDKPYPGVVLAR